MVKGYNNRKDLAVSQNKLVSFICQFQKLVNQYDEYGSMALEDKMVGKNMVQYIKAEVGVVYKELKEKVQNLKKNWEE